jgi:hypothetical protein
MKYLKTFESYSVNENDKKDVDPSYILTPEVKSNIENKVQEEFAKLTPDQVEKVEDQLEDFAKKHGLSYEDLQDVDALSAALSDEITKSFGLFMQMFNEEEWSDDDESTNESWLGDKFNKFKKWIGGFLVKLGLVGFAGTIIGAATAVSVVGESAMKNPEVSGPIAVGILSAFAISTLAYTIGASIPGEGKRIAQDIGSSTGRAMRS